MSGAEFWSATSQLVLQALHNRAVHLADAAFAQVERRADFFHRHLFVVVENDDEPFVAVEALGDQSHEVGFLNSPRGVFALFVFQNVDLADILVAVGLVPFLVETDESDGIGVGHHFLELLHGDFQFFGDLNFRRLPTVLALRAL